MGTLTTPSHGLYANTSTSALPSFWCTTGCRYLFAQDPALASWTSADASMPALRQVEVIVDPNVNTTSTSMYCNTAALSAYPTPSYAGDISYTIDGECNLVGMYARRTTSGEYYYLTVTLTETSGLHVDFGKGYITNGQTSTTDQNGDPSCLINIHTGSLSTPIGVYTGRVISTYFTDTLLKTNTTITNGYTSSVAWFSTSVYDDYWWIMPELLEYAPGVAAFSECTYIITGGSPIALTPANQIVLPAITLPYKQTSASLTSTSDRMSETTSTRPPTISDAATLPSSTPSRQQSETSTSTEREAAPSQGAPRPDPVAPTQSITTSSSSQDAVTDELPDNSESAGSSVSTNPPASQGEEDETIGSVTTPTRTPTPSRSDAPRSSAVSPSRSLESNSPGNPDIQPIVEFVRPSSSSSPSLGETSPAIEIVRLGPTETPDSPSGAPASSIVDQPADQFASYIAAGISGDSLDVDEADGNAYVLENGATLAASEEAVVVSGTTFSALSSGRGVVAIADGTSATLTDLPRSGSTSEVRISVDPDDDGRYVLQDGSTVTAGGQAVSVSGMIYSALPSGTGLVVAVNGQSTTRDAGSLPTAPPQISPDAYVLGGSVTVSAGGPAGTISGTTYSALPSDSGILVVANGETSTLAASSVPESDIKVVNSYIIGGTATISAGGSVAAISGTTYSALPSGSGVVVIEGGRSSTIGHDGHSISNATGGTTQQTDTAPYLGAAADQRARMDSLVRWIFAIAVLVTCVV